MDMNFLELAKKRKTTYEFSNKKIKDSDLKKILEAGRWAPSCSNSQPWHFIIIKNNYLIEKLIMTANYGDFHNEPSVMIAGVLLQKRCIGKKFACYKGKDSGVYDSFMSIGMTILNMNLEATSLGIDSCIITPKQESVKNLLRIMPQDYVPLILALGYEAKGAFHKKRERLSLKEITSKEVFNKNDTK